MTCFKPKVVYEYTLGDGTKKLSFAKTKPHYSNVRELKLPCRWCIGCRQDKADSWKVRIVHEAQMHGDNNIFLTLTYAPEHLPPGGTLVKSHFRKFIKALRQGTGEKIRYYMAGEYGSVNLRPHYHVILFNFRPLDEKVWAIRKGNQCYRSPSIEKHWTFGTSEYGLVTPASARYVSGYILKKLTGDIAEEHYRRPCPLTGEYGYVIPEYNNMSLRPGIGSKWYEKHYRSVFPDDFIIIDEKKHKVPEYYIQLLKKNHPLFYEHIRNERREKAQAYNPDNTPERLADREACAQAKYKQKERPL